MDLNKLEDKLDKIGDRLSAIDNTLTRNTTSLEHHIKRTDLLEEQVAKVTESIEPIKRHVAMVNGGVKLLSILAAILAAALSIRGLIK